MHPNQNPQGPSMEPATSPTEVTLRRLPEDNQKVPGEILMSESK